tara:strand:+ start:3995 stop:5407 length:1413 start_codon:yes stop_codon:yes gene_type:complete
VNPLGEDWQHLRLDEPAWLWLLFCIPTLVYLKIRMRKNVASLLFSSVATLKDSQPPKTRFKRWVPFSLRMLALSCLILALARPQWVKYEESPVEASGIDIVIAVDLSGSMLALDMSEPSGPLVTRLDVVKEVIEEFIAKRKDDRIGLVGFASKPYLISPLTRNKDYLTNRVKTLSVGQTEQTGTNIGGALAESINRVLPKQKVAPHEFNLSANTSQKEEAGTNEPVSVSFLVRKAAHEKEHWTKNELFFAGANPGERKTKLFQTVSKPRKLRLSTTSKDDWGYDEITVDEKTLFKEDKGNWIGESYATYSEHNFQTRIIILLTDGKDDPPPRHDPNDVYAVGAKEDGIKIYTIAVGRKTETPCYVLDPQTRKRKLLPDGSPVITRAVFPVDKEILREISETTGAQSYEASNEKALRDIYEKIDELEAYKRVEGVFSFDLTKELFHWPLIAGLAILLVEISFFRAVFSRIP